MEATYDDQEVIQRIAALDIGKVELVCCMRIPGPDPMARPGPGSSERRAPGRRVQRMQGVRTYSTMTPSLAGMADWLRGLGVTRVTRELDDRKRSRPVREGAVGKRTNIC